MIYNTWIIHGSMFIPTSILKSCFESYLSKRWNREKNEERGEKFLTYFASLLFARASVISGIKIYRGKFWTYNSICIDIYSYFSEISKIKKFLPGNKSRSIDQWTTVDKPMEKKLFSIVYEVREASFFFLSVYRKEKVLKIAKFWLTATLFYCRKN